MFLLVLALIGSLVSSQALADQVSLKNGDHLSGNIVSADGKTLVLHTGYAGDVTLKWDAVQSILSSQELHVELPDGKKVAGTITTTDDKLVISTKSAGTVEAPVSSVKGLRTEAGETAYEKSLHPGLLEGWKAGLNTGFALTRGNSESKNLSLAFVATRQTLHDKLGLYSNAVYASNDAAGATPSTSANTIGGGLIYDHDINKRLFGFVAGDFFSDALQGLDLRSVFGGGAGLHAIKNDHTTLDLLGGLNYTRESYSTLSRNFAALTLGEELMHKLGKTTVITQRVYLFPDLSDPGEFRGTFDFATVTKLNKRLGWQNSFSDVYVTNPPLGKRQNDVIVTTGLNISLGQ